MIYQEEPGRHEIGSKFLCPNCREFRYQFGLPPENVGKYVHKFIAYCYLEKYTVHTSTANRDPVTGRFIQTTAVDGLDGAV